MQPLREEAHGRTLFDAFAADARGVNWTYMPYGPFTAYADFSRWRLHAAFRTWSASANFTADGLQRQGLSTLTAPYSTDIVAVVGG